MQGQGSDAANPPAEPHSNLPPAPPGIEPVPMPGMSGPPMSGMPGMEPPGVPGGLSGGFSPPGVNPAMNSAINQAVLNAAMLRMSLPAPSIPNPMAPLGMTNFGGFPTPPFGMSAGPFSFGMPGQAFPQVPGQNFGQAFPGVTPGQMAFPSQAGAIPGMPGYPVPSTAVSSTITTSTTTTSAKPPPIAQNVELMDVFRLMRNAAEADAEKERIEKEKEKTEKEKKKTKLEPLTVEDLLNIPLPKPAPAKPKPGKGKSKEGVSSRSESPSISQAVSQKMQSDPSESPLIEVTDDVSDQENIVLVAQEEEDGNIENVQVEEQVEIAPGEVAVDHVDEEEQQAEAEAGENQLEPAKVYHFAWDNVVDDALSDVTISSVHTSDISSFEEEEEESEEGPGSDEDSEDKRTTELSESVTTDKQEGSPEHTGEGEPAVP